MNHEGFDGSEFLVDLFLGAESAHVANAVVLLAFELLGQRMAVVLQVILVELFLRIYILAGTALNPLDSLFDVLSQKRNASTIV